MDTCPIREELIKLKVAELRNELLVRKQSMKGCKAILVDRLWKAMGGGPSIEESNLENEDSNSDSAPSSNELDNSTNADECKQKVDNDKPSFKKENQPNFRRGKKRSRPIYSERRNRMRPIHKRAKRENEPEFDKDLVVLDWYTSDLSLFIKPNRLEAFPFHKYGFCYLWHAAKATYGVRKGRVCYEVKLIEDLDMPKLDGEEHSHVVRAGWSFDLGGLILGEEMNSWGFGGSGQACVDSNFKSYGKPFGEGDVLGCFLDMDSDPVIISYTINGERFGTCFEVPREYVQSDGLFPHIMTKRCSYKVNFGSEEPSFELLVGYEFIGSLPVKDRILAIQGPPSKAEAEVIMMVGLPASGKTTWVDNYVRQHPEKKINVLGTNAFIDRMTTLGMPALRNVDGKVDFSNTISTKTTDKLFGFASQRYRNYIIDQTNILPSSRRRKMGWFRGFQRRAVVVCPTEDELKIRTDKRELEKGKAVPEYSILEMKGNYKFPEAGESFDSVEFAELSRVEGALLVKKYNKEALMAGYTANWDDGGGNGCRGECRDGRHCPQHNPQFRSAGTSYSKDNRGVDAGGVKNLNSNFNMDRQNTSAAAGWENTGRYKNITSYFNMDRKNRSGASGYKNSGGNKDNSSYSNMNHQNRSDGGAYQNRGGGKNSSNYFEMNRQNRSGGGSYQNRGGDKNSSSYANMDYQNRSGYQNSGGDKKSSSYANMDYQNRSGYQNSGGDKHSNSYANMDYQNRSGYQNSGGEKNSSNYFNMNRQNRTGDDDYRSSGEYRNQNKGGGYNQGGEGSRGGYDQGGEGSKGGYNQGGEGSRGGYNQGGEGSRGGYNQGGEGSRGGYNQGGGEGNRSGYKQDGEVTRGGYNQGGGGGYNQDGGSGYNQNVGEGNRTGYKQDGEVTRGSYNQGGYNQDGGVGYSQDSGGEWNNQQQQWGNQGWSSVGGGGSGQTYSSGQSTNEHSNGQQQQSSQSQAPQQYWTNQHEYRSQESGYSADSCGTQTYGTSGYTQGNGQQQVTTAQNQQQWGGYGTTYSPQNQSQASGYNWK